MARNEAGLNQAIGEIRQLREEFWQDVKLVGSADNVNQELEHAGRVADYLEFGELLAQDALHRNESCGGHFREEHQTPEGEALRDDENYTYVAAWEYAATTCPKRCTKKLWNGKKYIRRSAAISKARNVQTRSCCACSRWRTAGCSHDFPHVERLSVDMGGKRAQHWFDCGRSGPVVGRLFGVRELSRREFRFRKSHSVILGVHRLRFTGVVGLPTVWQLLRTHDRNNGRLAVRVKRKCELP
jgi:hypothetical protein